MNIRSTRTYILSFGFMVGAVLAPLVALAIPDPPEGYTWVSFDNGKVRVLRPDNWFIKENMTGATKGYYVTKENIDVTGGFETGLTLNVIPDIHMKKGKPPSQFAIEFVISAISDKPNVLQIFEPRSVGPSKTFGCRIKKDDLIVHYFLIADDPADLLYLFIYESPEDEWDGAWKVGAVLLSKFFVSLSD